MKDDTSVRKENPIKKLIFCCIPLKPPRYSLKLHNILAVLRNIKQNLVILSNEGTFLLAKIFKRLQLPAIEMYLEIFSVLLKNF